MLSSLVPVLFETTAIATFQIVCVCLVSLFIVFCCIPPLHAPVRQIVRPWVVLFVESGLEVVAAAQRWKRPWLTTLFEHSSHSVSVAFYGSFLPCVIWLGLSELGWHLVVLMTLTLYVGNAMKDLVSAPRPMGVKFGRQKLAYLGQGSEEATVNAKEYGLPSSHTMNSLCLNFYACHYLHEQKLLSDSTAVLAYAAVMLWVAWIAASRIYLGVHTPIDILAGGVAGLTVVTTFISIEPAVNFWVLQLSSEEAIGLAALISLVFLRLHPKPKDSTPTFEFSTSFMGVMFGVVAGVSRCPFFFTPTITIEAIRAKSLFWILRRLAAGFGLVLACKEASRAAAYAVLPTAYSFFPRALRKLWQPPVHNQCKPEKMNDPTLKELPHSPRGRPYDVEFTSRFFAYAGIGFAVCELAPRLFAAMDW